MKPLITFDNLPERAVIQGVKYPIGSGYRTMMAVEMEMFGDNSDEQKLLNALNLFYLRNIPQDLEAAVDYMLWFHRCGEPERSGRKGSGLAKRGYCFQKDAALIYAAFREQYGINLRETKNDQLHWWEFSAMFECLRDDIKMAKVMYWRTCSLDGMGKKEKQFIQKMRALYSLQDADHTMDSKAALAKRNAAMKSYVRKRMNEWKKE